MSKFKKAFGSSLKSIRKSKGITQERLAELVKLNPRQISKIETGDHFPNSTTLENICIELEVSPRTLFNFDFIEQELLIANDKNLRYNANIKDKVVYLNNLDNQYDNSKTVDKHNIDTEMLDLAFNVKQPITVEYYIDEVYSKTINYFPDKTFEITSDSQKELVSSLVTKIKDLNNSPERLKFLQTALDALEDKNELDNLQMMITGIKIANKMG
ncbi:MAG: helix-turn-helix transcriptional regulator [Candidatus Gastranaerophilales bacterium]